MYQIKRKIKNFIEDSRVEKFIMVLIIINLVVYALDTVQSFNIRYGNLAHKIDAIIIVIFTIEYFCRVITLNKIKDIFKPMMIIDALAILPFYLYFCPYKTTFLRVFRLSQLSRILKLGRYSTALNNIIEALKAKKEELLITLSFFFIFVLVSSILVYIVENPSQPQVFSSIPQSFYFCTITFTTVGYGDIFPITPLGRILTSVLAALGIGFHGIFIGILSVAFKNAFKKNDN